MHDSPHSLWKKILLNWAQANGKTAVVTYSDTKIDLLKKLLAIF